MANSSLPDQNMAAMHDAFGKNGPLRGNVKAKASMWDQAFDEIYHNVMHKEKSSGQQENSLISPEDVEAAVDVSASIDKENVAAALPSIQNDEPNSDFQATQERTVSSSSPSNNENNSSVQMNTTTTFHPTGAIPKQYNAGSSPSSRFSGNVSRFLETRTKNFPPSKRYSFKASNEKHPVCNKSDDERDPFDPLMSDKKGFVLSGTGAKFLKSRRHFEIPDTTPLSCSVVVEGEVGTPPGYKSILRETGLAEVKRRWQKEFVHSDFHTDVDSEDKKNVRFNLEDVKIPSSSEEELNAEMSSGSDDGGIDEDPWGDDMDDLDTFEDLDHDDDTEVNACVGFGTLPLECPTDSQSLNPFFSGEDGDFKQLHDTDPATCSTNEPSEKDNSLVNETPSNVSPGKHLDSMKDSAVVKPLYDDTDSDSKGSSVRSIVGTTVEKTVAQSLFNNEFGNYEDGRKGRSSKEDEFRDVQNKEKTPVRSFKVASKLVGFLKRDVEKIAFGEAEFRQEKDSDDNSAEGENEDSARHIEDGYESECPINNAFDLDAEKQAKTKVHRSDRSTTRSFKVASKLVSLLKKDNEKPHLEASQCSDTNQLKCVEALSESLEKELHIRLKKEQEKLEKQFALEIDAIKNEHEHKLKNIRVEYEQRLAVQRQEIDEALREKLSRCRRQMDEEFEANCKAVVDEHKSQMTVLQKNHAELLEELERDLKSEEEMIKKEHSVKLQQMRDKLADELESERQRMKESGEERLYEKVRCEKRLLEDKYRCLKEKYARLKTEVKLSVERRNRRREAQALQQKQLHTTTTGSETERSTSHKPALVNGDNRSSSTQNSKPPVPAKTHLATSGKEHSSSHDRATERSSSTLSRKSAVSPKYARHLKVHDDTTSVSQSDTTISTNYPRGRHVHLPPPTMVHSDNGNSDSEVFASNLENNNNSRRSSATGPTPQRKKQFTRLKSASTSRLNAENLKNERPCTPVENLRHQLQKLEDLEDQFPDNAMEATYHLRYPFSDISNADYVAGSSSELEFFKHRIHLERDSVRRAKESLRSQRTTFRARQREIKQRHNAMGPRHSLEQLIQEEKDLTEMEVTLHRTRALLGEKVIRLRHLEQSVMRVCDKSKTQLDLLAVDSKEDATLSDLSSQSSSGFSSTDLASGEAQNLNKRRDFHALESNECIKNLEILNAEIREILDLLGRGGIQNAGLGVTTSAEVDLDWTSVMCRGGVAAVSPIQDRIEPCRQLTSGNVSAIDRMQNSMMAAKNIASQNPKALNYTNSLVERTRDIRNWLRQAKGEHDFSIAKIAPGQKSNDGDGASLRGVSSSHANQ